MRLGIVALIWLLVTVQAPGAGNRNADDESAIRAIVKSYLDARERRDEKSVRALFTEDADQLTSSGEWRKGRESVVTGTLASSQSSSGARTIAIETIRFPAPGVALADGRYEIAAAQPDAARRMWTAFLLVRQPDGWRISAIRNMLPAAAAPGRH